MYVLSHRGVMARATRKVSTITPTRKSSSIGQGGRGRRTKISTSTMNKHKRRSHKKYRGQGRN